jgi:hypothetical protein
LFEITLICPLDSLLYFILFRQVENLSGSNCNVNSIPPPPPDDLCNGGRSDDEEEVPPSDDEEQEDPKDYCAGR